MELRLHKAGPFIYSIFHSPFIYINKNIISLIISNVTHSYSFYLKQSFIYLYNFIQFYTILYNFIQFYTILYNLVTDIYIYILYISVQFHNKFNYSNKTLQFVELLLN